VATHACNSAVQEDRELKVRWGKLRQSLFEKQNKNKRAGVWLKWESRLWVQFPVPEKRERECKRERKRQNDAKFFVKMFCLM
jgi:hypothetical protein